MYNTELKNGFIRNYTDKIVTAKICRCIFDMLEEKEEVWDADLCTRTAEELKPVIDAIVHSNSAGKWEQVAILRSYVRYCIKNSVPDACDGMLRVNIDALEGIKNSTLSSPRHLQRYLNSILDPEYEMTEDSIYRCFCWIVYSGVPENEVLSIKCSDIDFDNMLILHNGFKYPIYKDAIASFKNCVNLTQFMCNQPGQCKAAMVNRIPGDTLLRGTRKSMPTIKTMSLELNRRRLKNEKKGKRDLKINLYGIRISGMFYEMHEKERWGVPVKFDRIPQGLFEVKKCKPGVSRATLNTKKHKTINTSITYKTDYERWKLAHNILY